MNLFTDTAKKHDLAVLKEKKDDFAEKLEGETVIADKGYVSKDFAEEMERRGVVFIAVKRENCKAMRKLNTTDSSPELGRRSKPSFQLQIIGEVHKGCEQKRSGC